MNWRERITKATEITGDMVDDLLEWKTCLTCADEIEVRRPLDDDELDQLGMRACVASLNGLVEIQEKIHARTRVIGGRVLYACDCGGCTTDNPASYSDYEDLVGEPSRPAAEFFDELRERIRTEEDKGDAK